MLSTIRAFMLGAFEFRSDCTTNPGPHILAYDWGREIAHRATFRKFEQE